MTRFKPRSNFPPVTPERLHEAMVYSAYLVERLGDAYAPIFERLADEWDALQRRGDVAERAREVLAQHRGPLDRC